MAEYGGVRLRSRPCHSSQSHIPDPAYKPLGYDLSPWRLVPMTIQSLDSYRQSPQELSGGRVGGIFREIDTQETSRKQKLPWLLEADFADVGIRRVLKD